MSNKSSGMPPFAIFIVAIIALNVFTNLNLNIFWVAVIGAVIWNVVGRRRRQLAARNQGAPRGVGHLGGHPGAQQGPGVPQLPTIDVPTYPYGQHAESPVPPGTEPPPLPQPGPPAGSVGPTPPDPQNSVTPASLTSHPYRPPTPAPGPAQPAVPAPQPLRPTSSDPAVSLAQLQLGRHGRELQAQLLAGGSCAEAARILTEVKELAERSQQSLHAVGGSGGEQRAFSQGLRKLSRAAEAAKGEDPPGRKTAEVLRACTAMSQDGRYE